MTEFINNFHFIRPFFFLLLIPLAWLFWQNRQQSGQGSDWQKAVDPLLLSFLLKTSNETQKAPILPILLSFSGLLAIIALAGPVWKKIEQPIYKQSQPLVIAFDLSHSMDSADLKPSRLTQAKRKLLDLLKLRKEGQTALLVYAAQPFVVVPLTEDNKTIQNLVNTLETDMMPAQGSDSIAALKKAFDLLKQANRPHGHILFITDGIANAKAFSQLAKQNSASYPLHILAVGTKQGAPIMNKNNGYLKDRQGQIVLPKLDPETLQEISQAGGGRYAQLVLGDQDLAYLLAGITQPKALNLLNEQQQATLFADQWREDGIWLIFFMIPFVLLAFRRGILLILPFFIIPFSPAADAFNWQNLWLNSDQQAYQQLQQKDAKAAAKQFKDPQWKAGASYQAGNYQQTLDTLADLNNPTALYNKGNALARLGKYKEAIRAYKDVLAQDANFTDASANKKILEDLLKKQEQQKKKQQNKDQKDSKDSKDQKDNKEQKDSDKKESQNKDQKNQQQKKDQKDSQEKSEKQKQAEAEAEQKKKQEAEKKEKEQQAKAEEQKKEAEKKEQQKQLAEKAEKPLTEEEKRLNKVTEQWLKRIPDDPAQLLRQKFKYQYQRQYQGQSEQNPW